MRSQTATESEIRWAQGVIKLADEILDLDAKLVASQKSEYLQTIAENASVESEETETD